MNLFLDRNFRVKIGDLGVAKVLGTKTHANTIVGTPYYLSPELCENKPYNEKSDVWALGCVLYELASLKHPFDASNQGALILKIIRGKFPPLTASYSPHVRQLIDACLRKDAARRPSVSEVLALPVVAQMAGLLAIDLPAPASVSVPASASASASAGALTSRGDASRGARGVSRPLAHAHAHAHAQPPGAGTGTGTGASASASASASGRSLCAPLEAVSERPPAVLGRRSKAVMNKLKQGRVAYKVAGFRKPVGKSSSHTHTTTSTTTTTTATATAAVAAAVASPLVRLDAAAGASGADATVRAPPTPAWGGEATLPYQMGLGPPLAPAPALVAEGSSALAASGLFDVSMSSTGAPGAGGSGFFSASALLGRPGQGEARGGGESLYMSATSRTVGGHLSQLSQLSPPLSSIPGI
jgi:hypothetical protein